MNDTLNIILNNFCVENHFQSLLKVFLAIRETLDLQVPK